MTKFENEDKQNGCFTWLIRAKRAFNERWAKARNAIRERFYRNIGKPLTPEDLLNDTGTPDLVITQVPVRAPPMMRTTRDDTVQNGYSVEEGRNDDETPNAVTNVETISCTDGGDPNDEAVSLFVNDILERAIAAINAEKIVKQQTIETLDERADTLSLTSSVLSDFAMKTVKESLTNVIFNLENEGNTVIFETSSMSSGEINDLAEAAVTSSLTRVIAEQNENQSARTRMSTPRTVSEVLEHLGIEPTIGIMERAFGDMPPCSN